MLLFVLQIFVTCIRFFTNLVFVLRTRLYCVNRKNIAYKIKHSSFGWSVRNVMFLESMLVFLALVLKNYIRFFINFYCGVSHLEKF